MNDTSNETLIVNYINSRGSFIIDLITNSLDSNGIGIVHQEGSNWLRASLGKTKIIIDLNPIFTEIATLNGEFDRYLVNSFYEMAKITTLLSSRLKVITAIIEAGDESERLDRLAEISKNVDNLKIVVIKTD